MCYNQLIEVFHIEVCGSRKYNQDIKQGKEVLVMSKETLEYVVAKAKELIAAPSCSAEAKEAAQAWIAAVGTDKQAEETKKFIAEMEEDIIPIDGLIAFAESDAGAKVFGGPEKAKGVAEHGREIKAAGAKYCDCPACAAVEAILSKKEELLG